jgi:hypothetical protein
VHNQQYDYFINILSSWSGTALFFYSGSVDWSTFTLMIQEFTSLRNADKQCNMRYMIDWLFTFTSRLRRFHLYGDVTITGEGLKNLGLCLALRAFEQGGIFIVPHLLCHGASVSPVSSEGPSHSIASYDMQGDAEDLFLPGPYLIFSWEKSGLNFCLYWK